MDQETRIPKIVTCPTCKETIAHQDRYIETIQPYLISGYESDAKEQYSCIHVEFRRPYGPNAHYTYAVFGMSSGNKFRVHMLEVGMKDLILAGVKHFVS